MKKNFKYSGNNAKDRYNLLTDDMLYNIIINLRNNGLSFDDLSEGLGLLREELLEKLVSNEKDFFVCLESLAYLQDRELFEDYSRINSKTKSK